MTIALRSRGSSARTTTSPTPRPAPLPAVRGGRGVRSGSPVASAPASASSAGLISAVDRFAVAAASVSCPSGPSPAVGGTHAHPADRRHHDGLGPDDEIDSERPIKQARINGVVDELQERIDRAPVVRKQ
jgi:hypothetical protein